MGSLADPNGPPMATPAPHGAPAGAMVALGAWRGHLLRTCLGLLPVFHGAKMCAKIGAWGRPQGPGGQNLARAKPEPAKFRRGAPGAADLNVHWKPASDLLIEWVL